MTQTAKALMKDVVCVSPKDTVSKAAKIMKKANIGSVFVGEMAEPMGIFTERDVTRRVIAEGLDPAKTKVDSVMTKKLVSVDSSEPLEKVFECLAKGQFRHLPVTEGGKVVGILSLTDLVKVLGELTREGKYLESLAGELGVE